jgi:superfamily II RNA helicase
MRVPIVLLFLALVIVPVQAQSSDGVGFRGLAVGTTQVQLAQTAVAAGWSLDGDEYSIRDERLGRVRVEIRNYVEEAVPDDTVDRVIVRGTEAPYTAWRNVVPWLRSANDMLASEYGRAIVTRGIDDISDETIQAHRETEPRRFYITTLRRWDLNGVTVKLQVVRHEGSVWAQIDYERVSES